MRKHALPGCPCQEELAQEKARVPASAAALLSLVLGFRGLGVGSLGFIGFIEFIEFIGFIEFIEFIGFMGFIGFIGFMGFTGFMGFIGLRFRAGGLGVIQRLGVLASFSLPSFRTPGSARDLLFKSTPRCALPMSYRELTTAVFP